MAIINKLGPASSVDYLTLRNLLGKGEQDDARQTGEQASAAQQQNTNPSSFQSPSAYSSNVMSGNFSQRNREQSQYVSSTLSFFNEKTLQELASSSGLMDLLEEAAAFATSDNPDVMQKQIERIARRKNDKKLYAEMEKNSKEMMEELERKAQEANAPTSTDGQTVLPDQTRTSTYAPKLGTATHETLPPAVSGEVNLTGGTPEAIKASGGNSASPPGGGQVSVNISV